MTTRLPGVQPRARILTLQMGSDNFVIPPGDPDYRVTVSGTMPRDALLRQYQRLFAMEAARLEATPVPPPPKKR